MINIILGIIMLFVLLRIPGLPKIGLLILLGLLYWINKKRTVVKPPPQEINDQDKDVVTLSKDQYKVNKPPSK